MPAISNFPESMIAALVDQMRRSESDPWFGRSSFFNTIPVSDHVETYWPAPASAAGHARGTSGIRRACGAGSGESVESITITGHTVIASEPQAKKPTKKERRQAARALQKAVQYLEKRMMFICQ